MAERNPGGAPKSDGRDSFSCVSLPLAPGISPGPKLPGRGGLLRSNRQPLRQAMGHPRASRGDGLSRIQDPQDGRCL